MDTDSRREPDAVSLFEPQIAVLQGIEEPETGRDRTLRGIFVALRVAEVHQEPIAQVLGNIAIIVLDDLGTDPLIRPHHLPILFGVELGGELCGVYEVTEQHRELAAFGLRRGQSTR
jgi:hypothetical protein